MQKSSFIMLSIICITSIASYAALEDTHNNFSHTIAPSIAVKNYMRLQELVPVYENAVIHPWPIISTHGKISALRERLRATGELKEEDANNNSEEYDEALENAVLYFQSCHGLKADGIVGPETLAELNIPPQKRLSQIRVNLSRWAKLANTLGSRYIMVNIPAYEMSLVENGVTVLNMRAIVGKKTRPTPEIESTVTRVILNPYWNVPKLIAQKDIIPKIINDPGYLDEMNIRVIDREEDTATEIDPDNINWESEIKKGFRYHFRQDPGENNALGLVKFEFPNSDHIYMHDTPAKDLFMSDKRAFSSGCIRLEKPFELANYLIQDNPQWDNDRINTILEEGKTSYIKITPIPIIITYLTLWVDDNGNVQSRADIYGHDVDETMRG
jgi:murein L,D-transpeptidase YcbB/YkuD